MSQIRVQIDCRRYKNSIYKFDRKNIKNIEKKRKKVLQGPCLTFDNLSAYLYALEYVMDIIIEIK